MITPRWVVTESQPVAIDDVLYWLVRCLEVPGTIGRTLEIGGPDVVAYRDLMHIMAEEAGLRAASILPVPVLDAAASRLDRAGHAGVVPRLRGPLAEGLAQSRRGHQGRRPGMMPHRALDVRGAIRTALAERARPRRRDALVGGRHIPGDPQWAGGAVFCDERRIVVEADARRRSPRCAASAEATAGTPPTSCGACAASWTRRSAAPACGADGAIPSGSSSARRSTSGGSSGCSATRRWR